MQRRTDVIETPRHRKYDVRTQYILHDMPVIKIIRHSIASDTLWVRNVRHRYAVTTPHTPQVRDRYAYRVAVAYLAIKLARATFMLRYFRSYGVRVTYVIEAATNLCERGDCAAYQLRKLSTL